MAEILIRCPKTGNPFQQESQQLDERSLFDQEIARHVRFGKPEIRIKQDGQFGGS